MFLGTVGHLNAADKERFTVEALSVEAITTSEIEGEILDRASVQSSIRRQLGFDTDQWPVKAAEQGTAEMMVNLHHSFAEPLSDKLLFDWHRMVTTGRRDLEDIGRYRRQEEPMQVVSGQFKSCPRNQPDLLRQSIDLRARHSTPRPLRLPQDRRPFGDKLAYSVGSDRFRGAGCRI